MALKLTHVEQSASMLTRINSEILKGSLNASPEVVKSYGMESLDSSASTIQANGIESMAGYLKSAFASTGDGGALESGLENLTAAQIRSGAIAASAAGTDGFAGYQSALKTQSARAAGAGLISVSGARYGAANPTQGYGMEAFEQAQSFSPKVDATIEYNIKAAKQDPVGEGFFPTTTITANDLGMNVQVPVDIIEPFIKHKKTGEVTDWQRKKLINALRDPTLLRNDATKLFPYKPADNSNNQWFVTGLDYEQSQNGEVVPTAPLKVGVELGFLGLCSTPSLISAGPLEGSDQIDTSVQLTHIWVKVTGAGGVAETFKLKTSYLDGSKFQKAPEGDKFSTLLQLDAPAYQITSGNKTTDGTASALLAGLTANGNIVGLNIKMTGALNHEKGNLHVSQSITPKVSRVYDVTLKEEITNTTAVKNEISALSFEILGYELAAQLRNSNFRTRQQRIDRQTSTFKYLVQLGAPITAIAPVSDAWGANGDAVPVDQLVTATYARNSAMAISRLLDYVDQMRESGISNNALWQRYDENTVEGVGKAVVDPWFGEGAYDISTLVNSTNSHTRRDDVSEQMLNIIRNYAYRMNAESGYNVALNLLYNETMPKLVVGTDNIIAQYLMETGDLRTAGISFKMVVLTTNNIDMRGKVVMTLSRQTAGSLDLLTFGMHLWCPEIVATVSVMREGTYISETMVQPRNLHVIVCPIVTYLEFSGLDEAYAGSITVPVSGSLKLEGLSSTGNTTLGGLDAGSAPNNGQ